ncbi:hypothetical protein QQS21_011204 [Conoideocrella luteorostrata]|uniref:Uncharacterized protein n=1 Tax=Conoideocrella luteorostrata TaxID=1105319 RepID=A0AAJ0FNM0_9HYPO|nr:hypothetical protein QQS21_011204 [Conoideocrella luteorostrata]
MSERKRIKNRTISSSTASAYNKVPASQPVLCAALEKNGTSCVQMLQASYHEFCSQHHLEKKRLHEEYKKAQDTYRAWGAPSDTRDVEDLKNMAQMGKKVLALRDEVNRRFFSRGLQDNRGHVQQILKIKSEVETIEAWIDSRKTEPTSDAAAEDPAPTDSAHKCSGKTLVYQSLLSPDVPLSDLAHLPPDGPVRTLRGFVDSFRDEMIRRLYEMAPSLNDSKELVCDLQLGQERILQTGDLIVRNVFREYLVWTGDTDVLAKARKAKTIDEFLRKSISGLDDYIKFFQALKSGRPDTAHFVRDAICDYLLPQDAPCMEILGDRVAAEPSQRKMGVDGWDLLYENFSDVVNWANLEQYSVGYEDLVLVKKLSALQRYGKSGDPGSSWLQPDDDLSQECPVAVLLGFVAWTKGFWESKTPYSYEEDGRVTETRTRDYLTGRMCKSDPLAMKLIEELAARVVHFIFFAFDGEHGEPVVSDKSMENNWITQKRIAKDKNQLAGAEWKTTLALQDIHDDLDYFQSRLDRTMGRDYYGFIIIDRTNAPSFNLLDRIATILMKLSGNLSGRDILCKVISDVIPPTEQSEYTVAVEDLPTRKSAKISCQYEGNRTRAWDILERYPDLLDNQSFKEPLDEQGVDILSAILTNLEDTGVITQEKTYQPPRGLPRLFIATDGNHDLYFHYLMSPEAKQQFQAAVDMPHMTASVKGLFSNATLQLDGNALLSFASTYKAKYPAAVFAKGAIHTHYGAWPTLSIDKIPALSNFNFCTPTGRLYKWNYLPFDCPLAFQTWQGFLHNSINCKLQFVKATQTTILICAPTAAGADSNMATLLAITDRLGLRLSVPLPHRWTGDVERLHVDVLWRGIQPLATL